MRAGQPGGRAAVLLQHGGHLPLSDRLPKRRARGLGRRARMGGGARQWPAAAVGEPPAAEAAATARPARAHRSSPRPARAAAQAPTAAPTRWWRCCPAPRPRWTTPTSRRAPPRCSTLSRRCPTPGARKDPGDRGRPAGSRLPHSARRRCAARQLWLWLWQAAGPAASGLPSGQGTPACLCPKHARLLPCSYAVSHPTHPARFLYEEEGSFVAPSAAELAANSASLAANGTAWCAAGAGVARA